ncbi:cytochrome c [Chitinophagales bacterium]|nr:cytochrome c [Chitinophagales bacterium]
MKLVLFFTFSLVLLLSFSCGSNTPPEGWNKNTKQQTSSTSGVSAEKLTVAKGIISSVDQNELIKIDGKKIYQLNCTACHGDDGKLTLGGSKILAQSQLPLEEIVAQVYHGKGLMMAYKGKLSSAEIVAVSQYVKTL